MSRLLVRFGWLLTLSLAVSACTRRQIPSALKPYWQPLLTVSEKALAMCNAMLADERKCFSRLDEEAPEIPLGTIAKSPAFYGAMVMCHGKEGYEICGFKRAGKALMPDRCEEKFRSAGRGWNTGAEAGEDLEVTDDPNCGLMALTITRKTKPGGLFQMDIGLVGMPDGPAPSAKH